MTRARDLSRLGNKNTITASATNNVGIGSTIPDTKLDVVGDAFVTGVVTATNYYGDGSTLTGITLGISSAGTSITSGNPVKVLNFVGTGNTFLYNAGTDTVDISIAGGGGGGEVASTITVTDESTDTTCFPIFSTEATGDMNPKTGSNLTFNSATGALTATSFVGDLTGDVTGNADTATTATNATNITLADESTDTTCFPVFATGATGNLAPKTGTNLTFNSSNGTLTATTFSGSGASLTSIPNGALDNSTISGISLGSNLENLTPGNYITGSVYNGANARTFAVDATSTNTASKVVARDGSGNFSAGTITATLSGNADTATAATRVTLTDQTSDTTCFPVFCQSATGNQLPHTNSSLTYNSSNGTLAATNVNSTSDANLKENIETIVGSIDILKDINGVKFVWKDLGTPSVGVIAQDVEKVLPELVSERDDIGTKSVNYNGLVGVLIEAVKELSARVSELENR